MLKLFAEWVGRTFICPHHRKRVVAIGFDGETTLECINCGKHFRVPL